MVAIPVIPFPEYGKATYTRLVVGNTNLQYMVAYGFAWFISDFILCFMMLSLFWAISYQYMEVSFF